MSHRKRHADDDDHRRRRSFSAGEDSHKRRPSAANEPRRPKFPSYLDSADIPIRIRLLCEILATAPSTALVSTLESAGAAASLTPEAVEEVLKLSYSHPAAAVRFFRWAGAALAHRHSPYAWNLVVDLLGKNLLFDAMWDAVASMQSENLLSLATFASIFASLAAAAKPDEALAAFDSMESRYGVPRDAPALNTLISAFCRESRTRDAMKFLSLTRQTIAPDADSYAILLEGCEAEADPRGAHDTFIEMVGRVGWDPGNVPAYDSFLCALLAGRDGLGESLKYLKILRENRCLPGMKFFRRAIREFERAEDHRGAFIIWDALVRKNGCNPDAQMYNLMISLQCKGNQGELAAGLFDEMVVYGVFPDSETYNAMLHFYLKGKKYREAVSIFNEMVKNEFCPSTTNCTSAMKVFVDSGDVEMGIKVWKCMVENDMSPLGDCANSMVLMLRDVDKLPEACKYAEDVIDKGIKLHSSTLSELKRSLMKVGKVTIYNSILLKWKGITRA